MKNLKQAALLAVCLASGAMGPTLAAAGVNVDIEVAPPAPRVEAVPAARPGYVWAPGYWDYRRHAHVWVPGHWVGERRGYHWVPDRWEQAGPRWHRHPGHWER